MFKSKPKSKLNQPLYRVTIRAYRYRGKIGYLISSPHGQGGVFGVKIFVEDLELAVKIKNLLKTRGWTFEAISNLLLGKES